MQTGAEPFKTAESPQIQLKGAASMGGGRQEEPLVNPSPLKLPMITSTQPPQYLALVL